MKKFNFKFLSFESIIGIVFVLVILLEAYVLYGKVLTKLYPDASSVPTENIVRLDLTSYNQTIDLLDRLKTYVIKPIYLTNTNPF